MLELLVGRLFLEQMLGGRLFLQQALEGRLLPEGTLEGRLLLVLMQALHIGAESMPAFIGRLSCTGLFLFSLWSP